MLVENVLIKADKLIVTKRERPPLAPEEKSAADRLKALWLQKKSALGLTQQSAATALGWESQGAAWQYLNGKIPLNWAAVVGWAKLLGVEPREIYPELADKLGEGPKDNDRRSALPPDAIEIAELYRQLSPKTQRDIHSFMKIAVYMARMGADLTVEATDNYHRFEESLKADMERRKGSVHEIPRRK